MTMSGWKAKKFVFDAVEEWEAREGLKSGVGVIRTMSQEDNLCGSVFNGQEAAQG